MMFVIELSENISLLRKKPTKMSQASQDNGNITRLVLIYSAEAVYIKEILLYEPVYEISNNVVCATSKASDQPAHKHSLNIL